LFAAIDDFRKGLVVKKHWMVWEIASCVQIYTRKRKTLGSALVGCPNLCKLQQSVLQVLLVESWLLASINQRLTLHT
jgi:hypothetical protein